MMTGLADLVRDRAQPLEDGPDQDGQRIERQTDHDGARAQPRERDEQREQRQRRDRVDAGADPEDRGLQAREPPGEQGEREGDHDPQEHRGDRDPDVLDRGVHELRLPVLEVLDTDPLVGESAVAARLGGRLHE
jgi:hypothetical protein